MENFFGKLLKYKAIIIIFCVVAAIIFPLFVNSKYVMRIATLALVYVVLTLGLNMLTGFMGQMSFGHAAFWGLGAYTAAIITTRTDINSIFVVILAALVTGMFGLLLGLPVLKLRGNYLTIVTMGFCEIIRLIEINWMSLTGGPLGISNIPRPKILGYEFKTVNSLYYLILVVAIITIIVVKNIIDSRIGIAITAIRDDDLAAEAMGVPIFRYKVMVFVISAMIAGVAGAFYAQYVRFIDPSSFTTNASMEILVMTIFGGLGSIVGSIIGALTLTILPELLRGIMQYRMLIYGILIVLLMAIKPDGIFGSINFKYINQRINADKDGVIPSESVES